MVRTASSDQDAITVNVRKTRLVPYKLLENKVITRRVVKEAVRNCVGVYSH